MSKDLGKSIPDKTMQALGASNSNRKNSAIFMLTVTERGYPHVALLSPYQVVARNANEFIIAVHSTSRSCSYLTTSGKATLVVQLAPAVEYIKCEFSELKSDSFYKANPGQKLFRAVPTEILEDYSDQAPFTSELVFDETNIREHYSAEFRSIKSVIESMQP